MGRTPDYLVALSGEKLYEQRARAALPLLVRQAEAGQPIVYKALAAELGMPNPRNLDYVLGAIGRALAKLATYWGKPVPPIQFLVISGTRKVPGHGIEEFYKGRTKYSELEPWQKREVVEREHAGIFIYPHWREVLEAFDLKVAADQNFTPEVRAASGRGGGEGPEHLKLKLFVASRPDLFKLPPSTGAGDVEAWLPSGDRLDVSFSLTHQWLAVEVKPAGCGDEEVTRGLFQCVKYLALIGAVDASEQRRRTHRAVLVLGDRLTPRQRAMANLRGVRVLEGVVAH